MSQLRLSILLVIGLLAFAVEANHVGHHKIRRHSHANKAAPGADGSSGNVAEVTPVSEQCLKKHNEYRAQHGSPDLVVDKELEEYAVKRATHMADQNDFSHDAGNYGENLYQYWSSDNPTVESQNFGEMATTDWYNEIKDYDFDNPGFSSKTGHFTQVVWKGTTKIGCAASRAEDTGIY